MPVPVLKFTCQFKCHKRAIGKEKDMARHEQICWKNPENKTCLTCSNESYEQEVGQNAYRSCALRGLMDFFDEQQEFLLTDKGQVRPICKCPDHNVKGGLVAPEFLETLKGEIVERDISIKKHLPYYFEDKFAANETTDVFGNKINQDANEKSHPGMDF